MLFSSDCLVWFSKVAVKKVTLFTINFIAACAYTTLANGYFLGLNLFSTLHKATNRLSRALHARPLHNRCVLHKLILEVQRRSIGCADIDGVALFGHGFFGLGCCKGRNNSFMRALDDRRAHAPIHLATRPPGHSGCLHYGCCADHRYRCDVADRIKQHRLEHAGLDDVVVGHHRQRATVGATSDASADYALVAPNFIASSSL